MSISASMMGIHAAPKGIGIRWIGRVLNRATSCVDDVYAAMRRSCGRSAERLSSCRSHDRAIQPPRSRNIHTNAGDLAIVYRSPNCGSDDTIDDAENVLRPWQDAARRAQNMGEPWQSMRRHQTVCIFTNPILPLGVARQLMRPATASRNHGNRIRPQWFPNR